MVGEWGIKNAEASFRTPKGGKIAEASFRTPYIRGIEG